jgi:hypothetical protein
MHLDRRFRSRCLERQVFQKDQASGGDADAAGGDACVCAIRDDGE